jgi:hypothetical protein
MHEQKKIRIELKDLIVKSFVTTPERENAADAVHGLTCADANTCEFCSNCTDTCYYCSACTACTGCSNSCDQDSCGATAGNTATCCFSV